MSRMTLIRSAPVSSFLRSSDREGASIAPPRRLGRSGKLAARASLSGSRGSPTDATYGISLPSSPDLICAKRSTIHGIQKRSADDALQFRCNIRSDVRRQQLVQLFKRAQVGGWIHDDLRCDVLVAPFSSTSCSLGQILDVDGAPLQHQINDCPHFRVELGQLQLGIRILQIHGSILGILMACRLRKRAHFGLAPDSEAAPRFNLCVPQTPSRARDHER